MPETIVQNPGLSVTTYADGLADSSSLEFAGTDASSGTAEAMGVVHGDDCDIIYVVQDSNGSDLVTVTIHSPTGAGMKPLSPVIPCSEEDNSLVRVTNTSGSSADYVIVGYEVDS